MRKTLSEYCAENRREELLREWDAERNAPLTPQTVSYGSKKKIWWRCEQGHSWDAAVYTRTSRGSGCPYCTGRKVAPGGNDLAALRPELVAQWDREKNGALTPEQVTIGSHRQVWWRCEKNHSWRAMVKSRAQGAGCPYCAGREVLKGFNDLATLSPELAAQWDAEKNAPLTPSQVTPGAIQKVWWKCERGHRWYASVAARTSTGCGCPYCAGKAIIPGYNDLKSAFPALAEQWDVRKNGPLTPEKVTPYSNRRVWWTCEEGHPFRAAVSDRVNGTGCPYCAGKKVLPGFNDLATLRPTLAVQWHPTLNGALTPEMVTPGSHKKVWWQCSLGHVWKAVIYSRAGGRQCGCPECAGQVSGKRRRRYSETMQQEARG